MAINIKKGNGLTLAQSSFVGDILANEGVLAGQVVHLNTTGQIIQGASSTLLNGIALNNQYDSDVIASKKIAVLNLDGSSVIETDQADNDITAANYPVGTTVYGDANGLITVTGTLTKVIGTVEGVRVLPAKIDVSGTIVQGFKPFLGVKLAA